jgi:hypothetical protein
VSVVKLVNAGPCRRGEVDHALSELRPGNSCRAGSLPSLSPGPPPAGPSAAVLGLLGLLCGGFLGYIFGGVRAGLVVAAAGLVLFAGEAAITNALKGR